MAEFSVILLGTKAPGVGKYINAAVKALRKAEVQIKPGAMGTVIQARDLNEVFRAVEKAHEALFKLGVKRVITEVKIDDRRNKEISTQSKPEALK